MSLTSRKQAYIVACCCLCKFVCCKGVRSLINSRPRLASSDCLQTNSTVCVKQIFVQRLRAVWQAQSNRDTLRGHSETIHTHSITRLQRAVAHTVTVTHICKHTHNRGPLHCLGSKIVCHRATFVSMMFCKQTLNWESSSWKHHLYNVYPDIEVK